jgi:NAD+ kinase
VLRPLEMVAQTESGATVGSLAYNEVSLLRQTRQAAHLRSISTASRAWTN